jgi:hypothetical protein
MSNPDATRQGDTPTPPTVDNMLETFREGASIKACGVNGAFPTPIMKTGNELFYNELCTLLKNGL